MHAQQVFFCSLIVFGCTWTTAAVIYLMRIIPAVERERGSKAFVEAAFQLNLAGNIRAYGDMAKKRNNLNMLRTFYIVNLLTVISVVAVIVGIVSTFF